MGELARAHREPHHRLCRATWLCTLFARLPKRPLDLPPTSQQRRDPPTDRPGCSRSIAGASAVDNSQGEPARTQAEAIAEPRLRTMAASKPPIRRQATAEDAFLALKPDQKVVVYECELASAGRGGAQRC